MKKIVYFTMIAAVAAALTGCAGMMPMQPAPKKEGAVRTEKYGYVDKQNSSMGVYGASTYEIVFPGDRFDKQNSSMGVYGASTYEIVEPVSWEDKHKCSVLDFVTYATVTSPRNGAQDVINVRAEELCNNVNGEKKCSCKYWGLTIRYKMLSTKEVKEIRPADATETPANQE